VVFLGIGSVLLAVATALASGILTIADVPIKILQGFASGGGQFVNNLLGGFGIVIGSGAAGSASAIGPNTPFALFGLPIAAGLIGLTGYIYAAYAAEERTTNFFPLIGTGGWDIPTPFFEDAEEEGGD
jgi:hypothetical protein